MTIFERHTAEEIIAMLDKLGLNDWSKKIAETIDGLHAPVQLANNLHHVLKNLKITHPLPPELEWKIDHLIKNLDKIIEHHHRHHSQDHSTEIIE